MNWGQTYREKVITTDQALAMIESESHIVSSLAATEPKGILSNLHTISKRVRGVSVITCLPMGSYEYFENPIYKDSFLMEGWFYSPAIRKSHVNQNVTYIPNHLHLASTRRIDYHQPDLFIGTCTPPDPHGFVSLSLSATYEVDMIHKAKKVILEVNDHLPRTFGDTIIHLNEIDYFVEASYELPELANTPLTEKDQIIGRYIADLVEDGSTIQLGIGGIPNAVAAELLQKRDLGIHTEMFTDGMMDLFEAGVVTGKYKRLMPGKMVATFALGSQKLYDFLDNNPGVCMCKGSWVNDPYVIGQNFRMVSINTTLEIDLTGQCCSESIGNRQFSGTGGQADTAIGAQNSEEGKSIIALYSTANIRVEGQVERQTVSKIVPSLTLGATVSLSRNDVDYVVTEYGIAALRGTSIRERVKRLIAIAHPDFRDWLKEEAEKQMIW